MLQFLQVLLFWTVRCDALPPIGTPNLAAFKNSYNFTTGENRYAMYWNVSSTEINAVLELESVKPLERSWVGFGIGTTMLSAEFIVCHNLGTGAIELHEHISVSSYAPPVHRYGDELMRGVMGTVIDNKRQLCQFRRALSTALTGRRSLSLNQPMKLLWAFNPVSGKNYAGQFLTYHGDNRGAVTVQLSSGFIIEAPVSSFAKQQIHGFGMMALWLVVFPFGAFYARYCRSISGWVILKTLNQTVGILLFLTLFFLILTNDPGFDKLHSFFGVAIAVIVFVQTIFGIATALGLSNESMYRFKTFSKIVHRTTGYGLIIFAVVQMGLGIDILYPLVEPRTIAPWIIYFFLLGFWLLAFGYAEWYFYTNLQRKDPGYAVVPTDVKLADLQVNKKRFTWESLNEEVRRGKMLVVANGRYVYDISQWVFSHPGGQIILHSVCGTDITNDYFHEAGFDAAEFTPSATPPTNRERPSAARRISRTGVQDMSMNRMSLDSTVVASSLQSDPAAINSFTAEDWQAIQRARRTHVHTRLAIEKLASMVVGELEGSDQVSSSTLNEIGDRQFNINEYRRYALTKFVHESPPDATKPFIRLRFCLLYPFDTRENQPARLLPGQCVEIEVRLGDGSRISRYYTPICGDMNAFELLVKVQPKGPMSQYLYKAQSGERQFKIRGPFGSPLLPIPRGPTFTETFYSTIYFFAGGSGITPFLQLANYLLLPTNYRTRAIQPYEAQYSDEMKLTPGDTIDILHQYNDGWCFGLNHTTGQQGTFPVACTLPRSYTRIVLFNCSDLTSDIMGSSIIEGAQLSYPALLQVHRFNSQTLTPERVAQLLDDTQNPQVVVCGPVGMNARVVDMLSEFGSPWSHGIRVLTNDRYN